MKLSRRSKCFAFLHNKMFRPEVFLKLIFCYRSRGADAAFFFFAAFICSQTEVKKKSLIFYENNFHKKGNWKFDALMDGLKYLFKLEIQMLSLFLFLPPFILDNSRDTEAEISVINFECSQLFDCWLRVWTKSERERASFVGQDGKCENDKRFPMLCHVLFIFYSRKREIREKKNV